LSKLYPCKSLQKLEFAIRNIPNTRLESGVFHNPNVFRKRTRRPK
jgi:hypothetical protein